MSIFIILLVLAASIYLIANFIGGILSVWLDMTCFWGRVAFRSANGQKFDIEYKFTVGKVRLFGGIIGVAGLLWSVIKLALIIAL